MAVRAGAVSAAALLALTACGGGDDDAENGEAEAADGETLTISLFGEEPYSWIDEETGEPTGATIAVAEEIFGERMGYEVEIEEEPNWDSLIPGLGAGHWDVVSAGMSINSDRCAEAAFGEPELVYTTAFLLEEGNPAGVENFEDLADADLDVVALSGAVESGWMDEVGVEHSTVDSAADGVDFVEGGRADVFALTAISLEAMAGDIEGLEVTDSFAHELSVGAHAFRLDDQDLIDDFNEHLGELKDSGEYLDLVSEFGFTEDEMPPSELTAEELCEEDPTELTEQYLED
ncbi:transporter substrate-binding domain-containing protein [Nesterenkonia sp. E16_7]|uniref:transporter substrate-binding domain-containing protein n=1 Tax=unclassified Nesterenkonia TaxID=2629769 RepID=UPI001A918870|nr:MULTISPECIES: transporter substrate-binding domain-containing protein [unclassified Nesterenkonia]MBO0596853.1 transporter substrate-binding domain-containing protein [Nesterenkonia sp. E16_10]MBO0598194.1 transporter substrate-binding domain-containing protein [Nesterenkonia sp. E16_7]